MKEQDYENKKRECWLNTANHCGFAPANRLVRTAFDSAFDCAYQLGKQGKDADTVIAGWVARNRYNELYLYTKKPHRINCGIVFGEHTDAWGSDDLSFFPLDKELFPDITWDNEPEPVEIIIKRKKK